MKEGGKNQWCGGGGGDFEGGRKWPRGRSMVLVVRWWREGADGDVQDEGESKW